MLDQYTKIIEQNLDYLRKKQNAIKTGLEVLNAHSNFQLDDDNKFLANYILDEYKNYLTLLPMLQEYITPYLKTLKEKEITLNQTEELKSSILIDVLLKKDIPTATSKLIEDKHKNIIYTPQKLEESHKILLMGNCDKFSFDSGFRKNNTDYVGYKDAYGDHIISYVPIDHNDITKAATYIMDLYNLKTINEEYDVFILPIIIHGLISSLQLFKDGNTRLSRVYQNVHMWDLTTNIYSNNYDTPSIYVSESLHTYKTTKYYKSLIQDIAVNPSHETFNNWINFNLNVLEKQIYLNREKIAKIHTYFK